MGVCSIDADSYVIDADICTSATDMPTSGADFFVIDGAIAFLVKASRTIDGDTCCGGAAFCAIDAGVYQTGAGKCPIRSGARQAVAAEGASQHAIYASDSASSTIDVAPCSIDTPPSNIEPELSIIESGFLDNDPQLSNIEADSASIGSGDLVIEAALSKEDAALSELERGVDEMDARNFDGQHSTSKWSNSFQQSRCDGANAEHSPATTRLGSAK